MQNENNNPGRAYQYGRRPSAPDTRAGVSPAAAPPVQNPPAVRRAVRGVAVNPAGKGNSAVGESGGRVNDFTNRRANGRTDGKAVDQTGEYVIVKSGVDRIFLVTLLILLFFGCVMVFSASYTSVNGTGDNYSLIKKHIAIAGAGLVLMFVLMNQKYTFYRRMAWPLYITALILLTAVIFIGIEGGGAQRWIGVPGTAFSIQPSELAKTAVVVILAWYLHKYQERVTSYRIGKPSLPYGLLLPLALLGAVCGLVVLEKHFSGLIIIAAIGIIVMFLGGSRFRWLLVTGIIGGAVVGVMMLFTSHSESRLRVWLNPELYPRTGGWQTLQGLNAIGSGGLFGLGLGNSRQKYGYVSEPQNDFVFSIVCEELGFIGAVAVITLFCILIWRGIVIAMKAPDTFSSLMVLGLISKVAVQTLLNIAVVTNSIPNTGISLPFFSSGGSSLLIQLGEIGMILCVSRYSCQRK